MKEKIKNYWYVGIVILCFLLVCILYNNSENNIENNEIKLESVELEEEIVKEEIVEDLANYFVDIKGEIKNPGVYEIESNKRIIDVIKKAGGLTKNADTSLLNLSKKVTDEMSIKIYSKAEVKKAEENINKEPEIIEIIKEIEKECICPDVNNVCSNNDAIIEIDKISDTNKDDNKLININDATKEELMNISGIGASKADAIIEYRSKNKFHKIEDILNVTGIGESVFEKIKQYITV